MSVTLFVLTSIRVYNVDAKSLAVITTSFKLIAFIIILVPAVSTAAIAVPDAAVRVSDGSPGVETSDKMGAQVLDLGIHAGMETTYVLAEPPISVT